MSFRAPPGLKVDAKTALRSGAHLLETELMIEKGASLGRAGRAVEAAIADLAAIDAGTSKAPRQEAVDIAAALVWELLVQQEACGIRDQNMTYREYKVPADVRARVGAVKPRAGPDAAGVSFLTFLR